MFVLRAVGTAVTASFQVNCVNVRSCYLIICLGRDAGLLLFFFGWYLALSESVFSDFPFAERIAQLDLVGSS